MILCLSMLSSLSNLFVIPECHISHVAVPPSTGRPVGARRT